MVPFPSAKNTLGGNLHLICKVATTEKSVKVRDSDSIWKRDFRKIGKLAKKFYSATRFAQEGSGRVDKDYNIMINVSQGGKKSTFRSSSAETKYLLA